MNQPVIPETAVPADETPAARCAYCERPFRTEQAWALHVGEAHPDRLTDAERDAHDGATSDEEDELFTFHMKVFVAIGIVHTVVVLAYMVAFA